MAIKLFNGIQPTAIITALQRDCDPKQIVSIMFRATVPSVRSLDDRDSALILSRELGQYESVEAYSCRDGWCDWFVGERILDETLLIGNRGEWWLLADTGTD